MQLGPLGFKKGGVLRKFWFAVWVIFLASFAACLDKEVAVEPLAIEKFSPALLSSFQESPRQTQKAWVFLSDKPALGPEEGLSYLEKLDQPVSKNYQTEIQKRGALIRTSSRWLNAVSVEASPKVLSELGDLPYVMRVEKVRGAKREDPREPKVKGARQVDDNDEVEPKESNTFGYGYSYPQVAQIKVPALHEMGLSGKGITIALLDAGFQTDHEAFAYTNLVAEHDFVLQDNDVSRDPHDPDDFDDGHGTMVWSVVGGFQPEEVIGPAYGANYLLARTEDLRSETPKEEDYWIAGLEWAKANGAQIISSSLGYVDFDDGSRHEYASLDGRTIVTSRAANAAAEFGILVLNAIGNEGEDFRGEPRLRSLASPSDAFGIFAVGAVDEMGLVAPFSSRGPTADGRIKPDVVAQGVDVWTATNETLSSYGCGDGTSFATPLVAGVAALLWEARPDWSAIEIAEALRSTASETREPNNHYGHGIVNAAAALSYQPGPSLAALQ